jgi:cell division protease FtsH
VAEKIVYDDITTGASNDLQVLTNLARNMVARWGMSEKMGPIAFAASAQRAMFGEGVDSEVSQEVAAHIDAEVNKIITHAHKVAEDVITKHRTVLNAITKRLIEVETIERDEFEQILIVNGIQPKKKEDIEHAPLA